MKVWHRFFFSTVIFFIVHTGLMSYSSSTEHHTTQAPVEIQAMVQEIMPAELINRLDRHPNPQKLLEDAGFTILQYDQEDPESSVVLEHTKLPGFVIKFFRPSAPKVIATEKGVRELDNATRAHQANLLQEIIKHNNLTHVKIPQKYIIPLDHSLSVIVARKIEACQRTMQDLCWGEIIDILKLIQLSRGSLNLNPKNFIIGHDGIYFIDTEQLSRENWYLKKKKIEKFKSLINPAHTREVDHWYQKVNPPEQKFHEHLSQQDRFAQCKEKELERYFPPAEAQEILKSIMSHDLLKALEAVSDPKEALERAGFKVIQYITDEPHSAVVIEHPDLPDYFIKFMRITAPLYRKSWQGVVEVKIADRVINAHRLQQYIQQHNLNHVKIPAKYFYCVDDKTALIMAKKVIADKQRSLKSLSADEIKDILSLVEASQGTLNLKPDNMIIAHDGIYFIDTERLPNSQWYITIKDSMRRFKRAINPALYPLVDAWFYRILPVSMQDHYDDLAHKERLAECKESSLKQYLPPQAMQAKLNNLFDGSLIKQLEEAEDPKKTLEERGFRILQYIVEEPDSAVIIEHQDLPGYLIKFMRASAPVYRESWMGVVRNRISDRVVNARSLQKLVSKHNLKSVKIPMKYFYCLDNNTALIIAQKIKPAPNKSLKDLPAKEIKEILELVKLSKGTVNFKPDDIIVAQDGIYFIDIERMPSEELKPIIDRAIDRFKDAVDPVHLPLIDRWYKKTVG